MITWGDVIDIITYVFDINQNDLAEKLGYDKSVISKIKNGKQSSHFNKDMLFSNVFDPTAPNSPANVWSDKPEACLRHLKEEIKSNFKEVQKDMDDCWEKKDYKEFVLTMLNRARKGPSSKVQHSNNNGKNIAAFDIATDQDYLEKQEGVSLRETPTGQMRTIFEQLVADYNIATYICKISDYLCEEKPFYAQDSFDFIDAIQTNILAKFISYQNESIFTKIAEFSHALKTYSGFLGMIRLSLFERYGVIELGRANDEIIDLIDKDCNTIKGMEAKDGTSESQISEMEGELIQLNFLRSVLLSRRQLCELFGEICPGKTLFVF